jgi:23S rRNA pseudouridine2605 synthase
MAQERIHVALAKHGFGSRRELEDWIRSGYIQVNGKPAKLGQKVDLATDLIRVRGKPLSFAKSRPSVVIALHKPRGVVTTAKDPQGRTTVVDIVPRELRLFPVGRLDLNSEGLILMTNDGDLAQHITHPKFEVEKIYEVKIRGNLDEKKLEYLKKGVTTADGKFKGAEILRVQDVTREGTKKYQVTLKVFEGKNHHVRKMFDAIRCRVIRLKRVMIGPIPLKGIPRGGFRVLSRTDVLKLRKAVGL